MRSRLLGAMGCSLTELVCSRMRAGTREARMADLAVSSRNYTHRDVYSDEVDKVVIA